MPEFNTSQFFLDNKIAKENFEVLDQNIFLIKKFNWNYEEALFFQEQCVNEVQKNNSLVFFILCSHPQSFTMGRGLQKNNHEDFSLKEFSRDDEEKIHSPLIQIKRGGGLTFHYPGQMVFYPILSTTHWNLKVHDFMVSILSSCETLLNSKFPVLDNCLKTKIDYLGLWYLSNNQRRKIASIGVAASRFITYHGLALNFFHSDEMFLEIKKVYPCGLPGDIYNSLEEILSDKKISLTKEDFDQFQALFIKSMLSEIKTKILTKGQ